MLLYICFLTLDIIEKVNSQIAEHTYGRLFAVVLMDKHQHKVKNYNKNDISGLILIEDILVDYPMNLYRHPLISRKLYQIVYSYLQWLLSVRKRTKFWLNRTFWFDLESIAFSANLELSVT